ncbi:carboxypeptidase C (cathepsin A) [Flavobacterium nitrogenifigens]|uniref:Carboxypeptidase C (Cathepsin A) n=2 Tax=Flavobacterium TaxID=237 RepID=A0A7W7IZV2_9FLAO|nr:MULTISPECIES: carboxypeptidase [Flavobacterium]MBB4803338.1 carboxypeptidase C (cathepsin A) [Flavobacterium nitrogenifigens]MBB6388296.1 carboxypeptidase C (cathepsin A) [Flavobacterium notoginsengisoli]
MKKSVLSFLLVGILNAYAQESKPDSKPKTPPAKEENSPSNLTFNPDSQVVTNHTTTIKGQKVSYKATAGTMPVWDEDGKAIAGLFYTYYERSDVKDRDSRPLVISFNGGPGSASVWMEIAYTGPSLLNIDEEGYPLQPYGIKENPYSILDIADIVFVNPVNTAYSRATNKDIPASKFFGVNADIKYLADWINGFVTRSNRWASPKYLIGESYGTTRVSGLALQLQNNQWMYLNGVILVSPTDLGITRGVASNAALKLPYFAATAWYHKMLTPELQNKDLTDMLPEVENFTINELLPALSKGGSLEEQPRKEIAAKMARYSGISEKVILQNNLDVPYDYFWKELLRDKSYTVGRLDSRYKGIDRKDSGDSPDFNAELTSWLHSFTPSINMYLRNNLNYKTDFKYNMFGSVHPWDRSNDKTGENLRQAMAQNPYLHVMVQSGYYDGACDYFNAKYDLWQMDPSGKLNDRMSWKGYRSGHMMYLRKADLETANEDIRAFIKKSLPKSNEPAKY